MPKKRTKKNAPRLKRLKRSTGWMPAKAVKIVRSGGTTRVLVKKAGKRKK